MAGRRPLVRPMSLDDINLIAGCWSWMENHTLFPTISPDFCIMALLEFGL
jgi:hypothetical protein